jgi:hypothetical protein
MANSEDWLKIDVIVPKSFYIKRTEKALCFKLWGKKFIAFPLKFIDGLDESGNEYAFMLPKWYIVEHGLKSIVVDSQKDLFPSKRELKERTEAAKLEAVPPLFVKQDTSVETMGWKESEVVEDLHPFSDVVELGSDEDIPW